MVNIFMEKEKIVDLLKDKFGYARSINIPDNIGINDPIELYCDIHRKIFYRTYYNIRAYRFLCPACGKESRANSNRKNAQSQRIGVEDKLSYLRELYKDVYNIPVQGFFSVNEKVDVECAKHGIFSIFHRTLVSGKGMCPVCRQTQNEAIRNEKADIRKIDIEIGKQNRINANKRRARTAEEYNVLFLEKFKGKFIYSWDSFVDGNTKIPIVCPKHGTIYQTPNRHLENIYGCALCSKSRSESERKWLSKFSISEFQYKICYRDKSMFVDGYDNETNTIYEYLGDYWHGHPLQIIKRGIDYNKNCKMLFSDLFKITENRFIVLKTLGYNVIYTWEYDYVRCNADRTFVNKLEYTDGNKDTDKDR